MPKISQVMYEALKNELEGERVYVGKMKCKVQRVRRNGTIVVRVDDDKLKWEEE